MGRKEKMGDQVKYVIYDIIMTPSPTDTGAGVEDANSNVKGGRGKNLVDLLNTSYDGFRYSDWASEFNLTVSKRRNDNYNLINLFVFRSIKWYAEACSV